jgi:TRAP transporter 4TM/12TM fusion protein
MSEKITVFDDETKELRSYGGLMAKSVTVIAILYVLLEVVALQFVVIDLWVFMALVIILVMILGFLTVPSSPKHRGKMKISDWLFMAMGIAPCIYLLVEMERLQWEYGSTVSPLDILFSILLMISLLELVRRSFGWAIPLTALAFLGYAFFGHLLPPEYFGHAGLKAGNVIGFMLGPMAIFGMVMSAMVQIIFLFIIFSAFLQKSRAGDFFTNLAQSIAGQYRGGPAKVSVFSSSLFGMISGSSVANVAVDGGITIPLMIRTGFRPAFAAAMEATASTGGQIMPPVMGAGAFIMAELLSISYGNVIVAAAIPAILYYVALYCMADLESVKQGIRGLPKAQLPKAWQALKEGWHLLIPVAVLLYVLIVLGSSMSRAGLLSIASIVIVSWFRKRTRLGYHQIIEAMREGAISTVGIAAICACAGIIVGVVSITGLGIKFGSAILPLSGGNLFVCLVLTAVLCLLLGLGLPTTASYIITASIGVPALLKLGVDPLAAHLFIFYYACISAITPPECSAIYTACGFSKTNVMETGWIAMRLAFPAYIVPFIFVYHSVLLMKGSFFDIAYQFVGSCIGVAAMSMALVGSSYVGNIRWSLPSRICFFASFFGFIIPGWKSDIVAVIAVIVGLLATPQAYRSVIGIFVPSLSPTHSAIQSGTIEKENEAERSEDLR